MTENAIKEDISQCVSQSVNMESPKQQKLIGRSNQAGKKHNYPSVRKSYSTSRAGIGGRKKVKPSPTPQGGEGGDYVKLAQQHQEVAQQHQQLVQQQIEITRQQTDRLQKDSNPHIKDSNSNSRDSHLNQRDSDSTQKDSLSTSLRDSVHSTGNHLSRESSLMRDSLQKDGSMPQEAMIITQDGKRRDHDAAVHNSELEWRANLKCRRSRLERIFRDFQEEIVYWQDQATKLFHTNERLQSEINLLRRRQEECVMCRKNRLHTDPPQHNDIHQHNDPHQQNGPVVKNGPIFYQDGREIPNGPNGRIVEKPIEERIELSTSQGKLPRFESDSAKLTNIGHSEFSTSSERNSSLLHRGSEKRHESSDPMKKSPETITLKFNMHKSSQQRPTARFDRPINHHESPDDPDMPSMPESEMLMDPNRFPACAKLIQLTRARSRNSSQGSRENSPSAIQQAAANKYSPQSRHIGHSPRPQVPHIIQQSPNTIQYLPTHKVRGTPPQQVPPQFITFPPGPPMIMSDDINNNKNIKGASPPIHGSSGREEITVVIPSSDVPTWNDHDPYSAGKALSTLSARYMKNSDSPTSPRRSPTRSPYSSSTSRMKDRSQAHRGPQPRLLDEGAYSAASRNSPTSHEEGPLAAARRNIDLRTRTFTDANGYYSRNTDPYAPNNIFESENIVLVRPQELHDDQYLTTASTSTASGMVKRSPLTTPLDKRMTSPVDEHSPETKKIKLEPEV